MRLRHLLSACLMTLAVATAGGASAAADVTGAKSFVEREHGKLKGLVDKDASADRVKQAIDGMLDYDELARRTLGNPCPVGIPSCTNHWDQLTPEQRAEVTGLLRQLVEANLRKNVRKTKNYEVSYTGSKEVGSLMKVRTMAKAKDKPREPPVQIDYMILGNGDAYRVVDVMSEGSSMTKNYYTQFHKMLTTPGQGYPYVVKKLREKVAKSG